MTVSEALALIQAAVNLNIRMQLARMIDTEAQTYTLRFYAANRQITTGPRPMTDWDSGTFAADVVDPLARNFLAQYREPMDIPPGDNFADTQG